MRSGSEAKASKAESLNTEGCMKRRSLSGSCGDSPDGQGNLPQLNPAPSGHMSSGALQTLQEEIGSQDGVAASEATTDLDDLDWTSEDGRRDGEAPELHLSRGQMNRGGEVVTFFGSMKDLTCRIANGIVYLYFSPFRFTWRLLVSGCLLVEMMLAGMLYRLGVTTVAQTQADNLGRELTIVTQQLSRLHDRYQVAMGRVETLQRDKKQLQQSLRKAKEELRELRESTGTTEFRDGNGQAHGGRGKYTSLSGVHVLVAITSCIMYWFLAHSSFSDINMTIVMLSALGMIFLAYLASILMRMWRGWTNWSDWSKSLTISVCWFVMGSMFWTVYLREGNSLRDHAKDALLQVEQHAKDWLSL